jgi:arginyl-tRNA synthetase
MQLKQRDFNPQKSYIVTGDEQRAYFNVVIKAAELSLPELKDVTVNIPTGTVKLSTGKMSSRTGDVLNIEWLFDRLHEAARERGEVQEAVIIAALRYAFLKVRIGSDIIFDVNEALSIEGNSGPYLQYAHARARTILAKSQQTGVEPIELDSAERMLVSKIGEYNEVVQAASEQLLPHLLCTYLYELSQIFNRFYEQSRVIGDAREAQRLFIVERYANVLRDGLTILGIPAPAQL